MSTCNGICYDGNIFVMVRHIQLCHPETVFIVMGLFLAQFIIRKFALGYHYEILKFKINNALYIIILFFNMPVLNDKLLSL